MFKSLAMTYEDIGFGHIFSEELRLSESAEKSNVVLYK